MPKLEALPNTWAEKIQQVSIRATPDILMCVSGVFVAIELKTDEGVLDPLQKYKLEKIAVSGGIAMIITPSNWEESYDFLKKIANQAESYYKENTIIQ